MTKKELKKLIKECINESRALNRKKNLAIRSNKLSKQIINLAKLEFNV